MDTRSGLMKAGTILLLVGGILQALGSLFVLLYGLLFGAFLDDLMQAGYRGSAPSILLALFVVLGVLGAAGSVVTFLGYARANAGDPQGAFVRGLVGSLLPPLQIVTLVGAILCKVSPEGEAHSRQHRPPAQPPTWH